MNTRSFGSWTFDSKDRTLFHEDPFYEIDLEKCDTSAEVLDWIFQINGKAWCDDACMADLVHAFRVTLDPQGTLCSWGMEKSKKNRAFPFQKKEDEIHPDWYGRD